MLFAGEGEALDLKNHLAVRRLKRRGVGKAGVAKIGAVDEKILRHDVSSVLAALAQLRCLFDVGDGPDQRIAIARDVTGLADAGAS